MPVVNPDLIRSIEIRAILNLSLPFLQGTRTGTREGSNQEHHQNEEAISIGVVGLVRRLRH